MPSLEDKLAATELELEELRQEYANFAYIVSHDLSAPMRHIDGFTDLILKDNFGRFDEKTEKHFKYLRDAAEKAAAIMSGLLEYSRLETRKGKIEPVLCEECISEALWKLDDLVRSSGADIDVGDMPEVNADAGQLTKLFFHLVQNALRYQPENSTPIIKVRSQQVGDFWEFTVKDNGIGIRETLQPEIFTILRRAVPPDDYPGIGMGLALASKIVKRHGGRIWAKSDLGQGTTVHFTLPRGS